MDFDMESPRSVVGNLRGTLPPAAFQRAMRAFTGNTAAAAFDSGTAENYTDGHAGNSQCDDNEAQ
jgi:hypothetical protein